MHIHYRIIMYVYMILVRGSLPLYGPKACVFAAFRHEHVVFACTVFAVSFAWWVAGAATNLQIPRISATFRKGVT